MCRVLYSATVRGLDRQDRLKGRLGAVLWTFLEREGGKLVILVCEFFISKSCLKLLKILYPC